MKIEDLPKIIPVFPLSNFILFPKTTVPLNIFEPRYIDMINDSMKSNKMLGMIQPQTSKNDDNTPKLYDVGCLGKITSFTETEDGRFLIELKGLLRFIKVRELIFKDLKSLFEKKGFIINWKALEKQSLDETINALAMASPFSLEEKQVLLEAANLEVRKNKISEILKTYTHDVFNNTTIQ